MATAVPMITAATGLLGAGASIIGGIESNRRQKSMAEDAANRARELAKQRRTQDLASQKAIAAQTEADKKRRRVQAAGGGRRGTILTSPLGITAQGAGRPILGAF